MLGVPALARGLPDGNICPVMDTKHNPPMIISLVDSGSVRVNRTFTERLGLTADHFGTDNLRAAMHPEDRAAVDELLATGVGRRNARLQAKDGAWLPFEFQVKGEGEQRAILGMLHESETDSLPAPSRALVPGRTPLHDTLDAMARIVEAKNPGMKCSILLVDFETNQVSVGAGPSLPTEYNAAVEGLEIGPMVGSCGTASFWSVPVIVEDIAADPLWSDLSDAASLAGVAACWSQPITGSDGEVLGAMALYNMEPSAPDKHHMDGLEIAARMVGLAIERDRLEEQLAQATKMEAIGVLAGGLAHDFNNMMAIVLGNAERAIASLPPEARATSMLSDIVTASRSASALCDEMLGYAGMRATATESLDFNSLIRDWTTLSKVSLSKKAELVHDLDDAELGVLADRSQLVQLILNLTTNAAEAVGDREGRIVIGTRAVTHTAERAKRYDATTDLPPGDYVRFWVSDSGAGMSKMTQSRIFDPFFTTKATGRGLGLAAVQGIVRGHNGALVLESEEGVGTTFSVYLPRVPLSLESPSGYVADENPLSARVLVVDDEALVRKFFADTLRDAGHDILTAVDGRDAIDVFKRHADSIDCVLLDLSMPKLNGEEALREMRRIKSDVKVVLCSGYAEQEIIDRFRDIPLAGVLKKPAGYDGVLQAVAKALARATA